jgi:hypothetical protein
MNTSSQISSIHVPVKMGSHHMVLHLQSDSNQKLTSSKLVEYALKRCRLNGSTNLPKTYALFENVNGVERLVNESESLVDLQAKWSTHSTAEFVIRKFHPMEKRLASSSLNEQTIRKCYKKLKLTNKTEPQQEPNIYEQLNDDENKEHNTPNAIQLNYLKRVLKNEMKLKRQANKIIQARQNPQDKIQTNLNSKLVENINFLKFLHSKLRVSNKSDTTMNAQQISSKKLFAYKRMDNLLNSSGASDDNSSRSSSTSTLESLV